MRVLSSFSQGPPGRSGLPGADGLPGPPGTVLMLPVRTLLFYRKLKIVECPFNETAEIFLMCLHVFV